MSDAVTVSESFDKGAVPLGALNVAASGRWISSLIFPIGFLAGVVLSAAVTQGRMPGPQNSVIGVTVFLLVIALMYTVRWRWNRHVRRNVEAVHRWVLTLIPASYLSADQVSEYAFEYQHDRRRRTYRIDGEYRGTAHGAAEREFSDRIEIILPPVDPNGYLYMKTFRD